MTIDFVVEARARHADMVAKRRDFHQHPELAFEETRTAGRIADVLRGLDMEVRTGVGKTGVVGLLEGAAGGPTVMVRADMDALPVCEENTTGYISTTPGKMHACGHDGHVAVALAVADILATHRDAIAGRVKFVFQPAEEVGNGAVAMIEDGVLDDPAPDVSLGLHFWSGLETGKLAIGAGPVMAGADAFKIHIQGAGGHGAIPEETRDPVVAAAQIIMALQTVVNRNVSPLDTAVLSVCKVAAGDAFNVIPDTVDMAGTFRTYRKEVRDLLVARAETIITGIAQAMGCQASLELMPSTIPLVNDEVVTKQVLRAVEAALGTDRLAHPVRTMGAEDMSYFLDRVPGCFFFVGSGNAEKGTNYPHHHPRFDLDEDAFPVAAAAMAAAVAQYVMRADRAG
ncbi:MAG: amidohydrolase [Anaerolineae bacterium]|nr:amidohydrolase [Anaerolineae bacterium]